MTAENEQKRQIKGHEHFLKTEQFAINTGPPTAFATNLGTAIPMTLGMDKYSYPISHEY